MYRFIRIARTRSAADVPAALQFSARVTEHLNKTYGLNMKAGIELFGKGRLHWHYEAASIDEMTAINQKLMRDQAYLDLLGKHTMKLGSNRLNPQAPRGWVMKQERRTPRYTTLWEEMPLVRA